MESYIASLQDESIVLITSKGRLVTRGPWTKMLELLGADKIVKLKDKLTFVGFKGSFRPDWVKLVTDEDKSRIHQVLPIPVVKKMKLRGRDMRRGEGTFPLSPLPKRIM
uniref:ILEI/PANDER domain-containing protein n=1 Tax=Anguilla anguilla TaxID=7936 RepID=A0A0E9RRT0_ANGAN